MEYIVVNNTLGLAWYAMKASYGKSLAAKAMLDKLEIENYVPMRYEKRLVNRRNVFTPVVAVPNLIFVRADREQLEAAKSRLSFLHNMLKRSDDNATILEPIVVRNIDMEHFIKVVSDARETVKFVDPELNSAIIKRGERVRVTAGVYEGYEGVLCRPKGSRSRKVVIDICGLSIVEIPVADIELLEKVKTESCCAMA